MESVGFYMHFGCCVLQQGCLLKRVSRRSEMERDLYSEQPDRYFAKEKAMSGNVLDLPITSSAPETEDSLRGELPRVGPVICYRDPADVRTIRRQSWLIIICFVIAA